ncbi:hypothetical protein JTB14_019369 [Gonioctena quinquepunctata]|nr:hypothetical protein JTB14_019369 [Gonioctena quinquepunctata]
MVHFPQYGDDLLGGQSTTTFASDTFQEGSFPWLERIHCAFQPRSALLAIRSDQQSSRSQCAAMEPYLWPSNRDLINSSQNGELQRFQMTSLQGGFRVVLVVAKVLIQQCKVFSPLPRVNHH